MENFGILSLAPAVVAVALAFITRDALISLLIGIAVGIFVTGGNVLTGFVSLCERALGNADFIWIMLIEVFIGIMVAYFQKSGAIDAFTNSISKFNLKRRGVQIVAWLLGVFIFFSDYFSILFVGNVMRGVTDKAKVSREKLAYICDSTAAPKGTMIPFGAWRVYMAGLLVGIGSIADIDIAQNVVFHMVAYNFYGILAIAMVGLFAIGIIPDYSGTMYANGGTVKDCTDYAMMNSGTVQVGSGKTGTVFKGNVTSILGPIENDIAVKGFGTEAHPYELTTAAELKAFRDYVNNGNTGACAVLMSDIDLNNEKWGPIGYASEYDETKAYSGTFDGNGHTISGLNANAVVSGLFGYTKNAAIKNLTVAGSVGGGNCSTAGGGIVGYAVGGAIENCGNLCEVTARTSIPGGGIVGFASNLMITGCYNAGRVFKGDGSSGGGIVGVVKNLKIYDCYNVGEIDGYTGKRGGIVGEASGSAFVYNCYNAGNVIKAESSNDDDKTVRGIVGGGDGTVQIQNCYYLEGTKADTEATAKSAEEFSNGTVLKLLKAGTHNGTNPLGQRVKGAGRHDSARIHMAEQ